MYQFIILFLRQVCHSKIYFLYHYLENKPKRIILPC